MKIIHASISLLLCVFGIIIVGTSYASDKIEVLASEGSVTVGDVSGKSEKTVQSKSVLPNTNVLTTGPTARAVVRVGSTGIIVVGKNSRVEINKPKDKPGFFRQISGLVYYAVNAITGKQRGVEVKTATSVIGIRGTRFIVTDVEGRNEIGMRKGLVSVTNPEGEFEIHKKAEMDEFEAFKKEGEAAIAQSEREFEEYKAKTQQEFVEYKKEFSLAADRMVSIDGNRVEDLPLSGQTKKDMESFEEYAEDWLNKVND